MSQSPVLDPRENSAASPLQTAAILPSSALVAIAILMLLVIMLTMAEIPLYMHTTRVRMGELHTIMLSSLLVISCWMLIELHSKRYARFPLQPPKRWFLHQLRRLPLLILGYVAFTNVLRHIGFMLSKTDYLVDIRFILVYESVKVSLLFCCWLGLVFGILSFAQMRAQAEHLLSVQKAMVEAKLTRLQAQLRPHFLFNALNTISAYMQVDIARADRLLTLLGDLLRANLDTSERSVVPLAEELNLLRQYADIMQARFADRVSIEWNVAAEALGASVPTMLLQPLLENAFKHGVERSTAAQVVAVSVQRAAENLQVVIHNTGSPLSEPSHEGWGLRNCRERLELLYGANASLTLSNTAAGVEVKVIMPWSVATE
jgi:hypothetical protein